MGAILQNLSGDCLPLTIGLDSHPCANRHRGGCRFKAGRCRDSYVIIYPVEGQGAVGVSRDSSRIARSGSIVSVPRGIYYDASG